MPDQHKAIIQPIDVSTLSNPQLLMLLQMGFGQTHLAFVELLRRNPELAQGLADSYRECRYLSLVGKGEVAAADVSLADQTPLEDLLESLKYAIDAILGMADDRD